MDISEIRHRNLGVLLDEFRRREITMVKDHAHILGMPSSYLSQLKGGKKMGDDVARKVEAAAGKPHGWMDVPQWLQAPALGHEIALARAAPRAPLLKPIRAFDIRAVDGEDGLEAGDALIDEVEMVLGAGPGQWVPEFVETKFRMPYQIEWLKRHGAKAENVKVMRVRGDSMRGVVWDGDKVAVHMLFDKTQIRSGGVYAFALDGETVIKRLFRHGGGLRIVSDNEDKTLYPDVIVTAEDLAERVQLFGPVIDKSGAGGLFA